jgi:hypothetical protein
MGGISDVVSALIFFLETILMALAQYWKPGVALLGAVVLGVGAWLWFRPPSSDPEEERPLIPGRDVPLPKDVTLDNLPNRPPEIKDLPPPRDDFRAVPPPRDALPPLPKDAPPLPALPKPPKDVVPHKDFPAADFEKRFLDRRE